MADFINTADVIGDEALLDSLIDGTIVEYKDDTCTKVGMKIFAGRKDLVAVEVPNATYIDAAFDNVTAIKSLVFQNATQIGNYNFNSMSSLEYLDFWKLEAIPPYGIALAQKLKALVLRKTDGICTLAGTKNVWGTPYIYVPAALIDTYKTATNWSTFADQFRALEDYTVDGTIMGELDWDKINAAA